MKHCYQASPVSTKLTTMRYCHLEISANITYFVTSIRLVCVVDSAKKELEQFIKESTKCCKEGIISKVVARQFFRYSRRGDG